MAVQRSPKPLMRVRFLSPLPKIVKMCRGNSALFYIIFPFLFSKSSIVGGDGFMMMIKNTIYDETKILMEKGLKLDLSRQRR